MCFIKKKTNGKLRKKNISHKIVCQKKTEENQKRNFPIKQFNREGSRSETLLCTFHLHKHILCHSHQLHLYS